MAIGVEGTHYKIVDGAYEPIQPIFTDERNLANNYMAGTDEENYPQYWQARVRKTRLCSKRLTSSTTSSLPK